MLEAAAAVMVCVYSGGASGIIRIRRGTLGFVLRNLCCVAHGGEVFLVTALGTL